MVRPARVVGSLALVISVGARFISPALAQTSTTYYLHNESSSNFGLYQLKTTGPDASQLALLSSDLKGHGAEDNFQYTGNTQSGIPHLAGIIPSGSTVTFTLFMRKTSANGVVFPRAQLSLNWPVTATLCSANGGTALTTTLQAYTFSCTTSSVLTMTLSDRVTLLAGYHMTTGPGNKSMKVELDVETTSSNVQAPNPVPPNITNLSDTSGPVNWPVTITGSSFGSSTGTVKFNGTTAITTSWSDTSIATTVPAAATSGPVTVTTVQGATTNGVTFTVIPPPTLTALSRTSAHIGDSVTITGANFLSTQGSSTVTFNGTTATPTSWSNTSITAPVPTGATSGNVVVTVSSQASNGLALTVIIPGTIGGTVTRATGGSALSGATVQAFLAGVLKGSTATAADGTYTIASLDPASYDVRVSASGYSTEARSGIAVSSSTTTTVNVAMMQPGSISGTVTVASGGAPIAGAAVAMYLGSIQKASTSTNANGTYAIANLHPGAYTVQAVDVGYRTKEVGATVSENANTTSNLALDPAAQGPVLYAYDALSRLIQVTDPSGDAAFYHYDAVGNITAIDRVAAGTTVAISGLTPISGAIGTAVMLYGAGFGATQGTSTVTFNGTPATVTGWSNTAIAAIVPAGATTGPAIVTVNGQSSNGVTFSVTPAGAGAPTVSGFTPTLVATGDTITVTGTNFDTTPANNRLTANLAAAQVTSAGQTSLQAIVPVTTTGRVAIGTQNGSATSTNYLWVAPPSYATTTVDSTGPISLGTTTPIAVNTAGKIALRAFENIQGHRVSVGVTNGTFPAGGVIAIYGVHADPHPTGFGSIGFLEPVDLNATGTYTLLLAPNSGTGTADVTVYDVPSDVTGPILPGGSNSVPVHISTAGQNARLTFSGIAGGRASVGTDNTTTIPSGRLKVLRPDGTTLGDIGFIPNFGAFLDPVPLDTSGTYTVLVDPDTTNTGDTRVTLYDVPADTTGPVNINGDPVPVSLVPGQNGSLTFSGSQNQQVTVHVTGNTMGSVTVKLLYIDGQNQTVLAQAFSALASFDLTPATLPTPGTATYTITIDPLSANTGTLNLTVTSP